MAVIVKVVIFWAVIPCTFVAVANLSEEHVASIFEAELRGFRSRLGYRRGA
jgi:hypothetical protein